MSFVTKRKPICLPNHRPASVHTCAALPSNHLQEPAGKSWSLAALTYSAPPPTAVLVHHSEGSDYYPRTGVSKPKPLPQKYTSHCLLFCSKNPFPDMTLPSELPRQTLTQLAEGEEFKKTPHKTEKWLPSQILIKNP